MNKFINAVIAVVLLLSVTAYGASFPYVTLNSKTNRLSDNGTNLTYNGNVVGTGTVGTVLNTTVSNALAMPDASKTNLVAATSQAVQNALGQVYMPTNTGVLKAGDTMTGSLRFSGASTVLGTPNLTTAQKNALTPQAGDLVFDSDLGRFQAYDGSAWHSRVRLDGDTMTGPLLVTGLTNTANTASRFIATAADKSETTTAASAALAATLSDETGTGSAVFNTSPNFLTGLTVNGVATFSDSLFGGMAVTRATLTHAGTVTLDCSLTNRYASLTLTGNVTFATANLAAGKWYNVIVTMTATNDTPTFPAWKWLGGAPSTLTASQIGVLSIYPTSTTDATTLAAYTETQ